MNDDHDLQPRRRRCRANRRQFIAGMAATAGASAVALIGKAALAQEGNAIPGEARDWTGTIPTRYPDPDIIALDPAFDRYKLANTPIQRISPIQRTFHSPDMLWAEGPAWNGVGRYLLWSDIPNDVQLRWLEEDGHSSEEDGHSSTFRSPSGNSNGNGNTFDYQGREHAVYVETQDSHIS